VDSRKKKIGGLRRSYTGRLVGGAHHVEIDSEQFFGRTREQASETMNKTCCRELVSQEGAGTNKGCRIILSELTDRESSMKRVEA